MSFALRRVESASNFSIGTLDYPGIGPITATAITALAPPSGTFTKGRDFAAWVYNIKGARIMPPAPRSQIPLYIGGLCFWRKLPFAAGSVNGRKVPKIGHRTVVGPGERQCPEA